jgi:hypothetical protein
MLNANDQKDCTASSPVFAQLPKFASIHKNYTWAGHQLLSILNKKKSKKGLHGQGQGASSCGEFGVMAVLRTLKGAAVQAASQERSSSRTACARWLGSPIVRLRR